MTTLMAKTFQQLLEQLENNIHVERGRVSHCARDGVFLLIAPWDPLDDTGKYIVTLGCGMPPDPAVQDLPCGILTSDGQHVASANRTDRRGQFTMEASGDFRVHFVTDVRDVTDVDILLRLGDDEAIEFLEDRLEDDQTTPFLRQYIRNQLAAGRPLRLERLPADLRWAAADADMPGSAKPAGSGWRIGEKGLLSFRCPADQAGFPYSAVFVELRGRDVVVGSRLMAVFRVGEYYENTLELRDFLKDRTDYASLQPAFWADKENIRRRVSPAEVDRLLNTPYVQNRPEIRGPLEQLKEDLGGPGPSDSTATPSDE